MKRIFATAVLVICLGGLSASAQTTTTTTKTGSSQPKKDAIIGGVAGAVTGAVVSKHKGTGAVVGGAVGAGGGYLYGKHRQKHHPKTVVKSKTVVTPLRNSL